MTWLRYLPKSITYYTQWGYDPMESKIPWFLLISLLFFVTLCIVYVDTISAFMNEMKDNYQSYQKEQKTQREQKKQEQEQVRQIAQREEQEQVRQIAQREREQSRRARWRPSEKELLDQKRRILRK